MRENNYFKIDFSYLYKVCLSLLLCTQPTVATFCFLYCFIIPKLSSRMFVCGWVAFFLVGNSVILETISTTSDILKVKMKIGAAEPFGQVIL